MKVVSWDGNSINDGTSYVAGLRPALEWGLPGAAAVQTERYGAWPLVSRLRRPGRKITLVIQIKNRSSLQTLWEQLMRWFDPEDEDPKTLVGETHGGVEVSIECLCEDLRVYGDLRRDTIFVATMVVSDDVRWRATSATTDT